jgi:hypothetical protein
LDAVKPETSAGGTPGVVTWRTFDRPETLGTSSRDFSAKYTMSSLGNPEAITDSVVPAVKGWSVVIIAAAVKFPLSIGFRDHLKS